MARKYRVDAGGIAQSRESASANDRTGRSDVRSGDPVARLACGCCRGRCGPEQITPDDEATIGDAALEVNTRRRRSENKVWRTFACVAGYSCRAGQETVGPKRTPRPNAITSASSPASAQTAIAREVWR